MVDSRVEALIKALEPFARVALIMDKLPIPPSDDTPLRDVVPGVWPVLGDCRIAAAEITKVLGEGWSAR